jgi:hypothetical protein
MKAGRVLVHLRHPICRQRRLGYVMSDENHAQPQRLLQVAELVLLSENPRERALVMRSRGAARAGIRRGRTLRLSRVPHPLLWLRPSGLHDVPHGIGPGGPAEPWLKEGRTAVLVVPSAITPRERNVLLNPKHPDMNLLQADAGQPFHFDPRMFEKRE